MTGYPLTKEDIEGRLKEAVAEYGDVSLTEFRSVCNIGWKTIRRLYGSWNDLRREVGLPVYGRGRRRK